MSEFAWDSTDPSAAFQARVAEQERQRPLRSCLSASVCQICGSHDGMMDWHSWNKLHRRAILARQAAGQQFYIIPHHTDSIYTTCGGCNPDDKVPSDYQPITEERLYEWLYPFGDE